MLTGINYFPKKVRLEFDKLRSKIGINFSLSLDISHGPALVERPDM